MLSELDRAFRGHHGAIALLAFKECGHVFAYRAFLGKLCGLRSANVAHLRQRTFRIGECGKEYSNKSDDSISHEDRSGT